MGPGMFKLLYGLLEELVNAGAGTHPSGPSLGHVVECLNGVGADGTGAGVGRADLHMHWHSLVPSASGGVILHR